MAAQQASVARSAIQKTVSRYDREIARYALEKEQIQAQARALENESEIFKRHAGHFGIAVMLLQIAIMLSSVSALTKKMWMWFIGLGFGVSGLSYMIVGFVL